MSVLELQNVTKRYPGIVANDHLSLSFTSGEVHVLLGENGAGKSTLVSLLSGLQMPDQGHITLDGKILTLSSPAIALHAGIGTVYQHAMLVPSLTIAENLVLEGPWWAKADVKIAAEKFTKIATDIGVQLNPAANVASLSLGEQQMAEIVRALMRESKFLILDEATAMLSPIGAERLGALMRRLAQAGLGVIFITHKLREALSFGDRISVLRHGKLAGQLQIRGNDAEDNLNLPDKIVALMFGSTAAQAPPPPPRRATHSQAVLNIEALQLAGTTQALTFSIAAGEILGIAGIDGQGQKQLAEALAGQAATDSGRILLDNADITYCSIAERRARGLRYITDDRLAEGIIGSFSVSLNLLLKNIAPPFWRHAIQQRAAIATHARDQIAAFDIRTPSPETPAGKLSGGNIQKILLARELSGPARVIIFAKPTNGLDVQNMRATRDRIRNAAASGLGVLLISTDLDEILELSHRIMVMQNRQLSAPVFNGPAARQRTGAIMSGAAA